MGTLQIAGIENGPIDLFMCVQCHGSLGCWFCYWTPNNLASITTTKASSWVCVSVYMCVCVFDHRVRTKNLQVRIIGASPT